MKNTFKITACAALLLAAVGAQAEQTDITVTANIDPTVSLTQADGSALPDSIKMKYKAGVGLQPYQNNVKIWSNLKDAGVNVKLVQTPKLLDQKGQNPIELGVALNGSTLSTADTAFTYATIFPQGIANGSAVMPLNIIQKDTSAAAISAITAGQYSGLVSIVVSQALTTPKP
ncbi:CS1 type fimbrial major subunit [Serratia liquefaciens]|uniref:CS1 type fimbrial major subunit n=1 Tax=Serratia liquefaciens TaxID=614 RepID=UPI0023616987|nr:CS1 type fimbrial major subunit [Serratia liquefaciens]